MANNHFRRAPLAVFGPSGDTSLSLIGWFDDQVSRLQDDLIQNEFFDVPQLARIAFNPARKSKLFDALFSDDQDNLDLKFYENPNKNQIECQVTTGCGDFFRPEDIKLNVKDRNVEFTARRELKSDDGHNYTVREVRRVFKVPEGAEVDKLHAEMTPNGRVMVTAPLSKPKPIEKKPSEPVPIKINRL